MSVQWKPLPDPLPDHVTLSGEIATFTLPNPHDPAKPFICTVRVKDGQLELLPKRSANHKRVLASL